MEDKKYIIGIDLGTTNCAVSFVDLNGKRQIQKFNVDQLTGEGEVAKLPILPSFLYIPGDYEIKKDSLKLPWKTVSDNFTGTFAMEQGSRVPARLISSAKSWLCNGKVDRNSRILPWGSGDDVFKESPVYATSQYLNHIKNAWNNLRGDNEDLYLENQNIIITVPASFDEVARELTVEAALKAGLKNVTLIEEPLAAFYSWLIKNEKSWEEHVNPGELILVCDVGGGTTDFTLITLKEVEGNPKFERIAVGDHLILGGDNIDIKIADEIRKKLKNKNLSQEKWKTLCHQSRRAKENILNGESETETITIMGSGSSLIAGTISSKIEKDHLERTVFDNFFPVVDKNSHLDDTEDKNLFDGGLPYEKDNAITRKLCEFLEKNKGEVKKTLGKLPVPDHILFNGGSLKSEKIQGRIIEAVKYWFRDEESKEIKTLENSNHDLAVALGASYYGLVKTGHGVKVGSGSPRSYYLGINTENSRKSVICLIERGLDEGSEMKLEQNFDVIANKPVSFDVYSSSYRSGDKTGDIISIDDSLVPLSPVQTIIKYGKKGDSKNIPVNLEAEYTEIGTLKLFCKSVQSQHRWQLQFHLRNSDESVAQHEVLDESIVNKIKDEIKEAFEDTEKLKKITRKISEIAESSKEKWPLGLIRKITDELLENAEVRKKSLQHEARWLNLTGFCLRPGCGDGFDEFRIKKLWKIYRDGIIFDKNQQNRSEWWILWRRVAGGLSAGQQRQIFQDLSSVIFPKKGNKIKASNQELNEIWMLIANLEKLITKDKIRCGNELLSQIKPKKIKPQQIWALSRIGARDLLYGSIDRVIPVDDASFFIEKLLSFEYKNHKSVGISLYNLGRKTGDRNRDISNELSEKIIDFMESNNIEDHYIRGIKEVSVSDDNKEQIYGESLPAGLVLREE